MDGQNKMLIRQVEEKIGNVNLLHQNLSVKEICSFLDIHCDRKFSGTDITYNFFMYHSPGYIDTFPYPEVRRNSFGSKKDPFKVKLSVPKCYFHSQDVQIFVYLSSPLLFPVSHCFRGLSKINLMISSIVYLNKEPSNKFCLIS